MADLQAKVQAAADEMVAAGTETGLQIAVHRYGRVVADVVSGVADAGTTAPVGHGTDSPDTGNQNTGNQNTGNQNTDDSQKGS